MVDGPVAVITPGLVWTPGVIGSISPPILENPPAPTLEYPKLTGPPKPPIGPTGLGPPMNPPGAPPTILGGPTGVTTPGVVWIPGVIGSASKAGAEITLVVAIGAIPVPIPVP